MFVACRATDILPIFSISECAEITVLFPTLRILCVCGVLLGRVPIGHKLIRAVIPRVQNGGIVKKSVASSGIRLGFPLGLQSRTLPTELLYLFYTYSTNRKYDNWY